MIPVPLPSPIEILTSRDGSPWEQAAPGMVIRRGDRFRVTVRLSQPVHGFVAVASGPATVVLWDEGPRWSRCPNVPVENGRVALAQWTFDGDPNVDRETILVAVSAKLDPELDAIVSCLRAKGVRDDDAHIPTSPLVRWQRRLEDLRQRGVATCSTTFDYEHSEEADLARHLVERGYQLGIKLGAGSFADVYQVEEVATGAQMALKVLKAEWLRDPEVLARFTREMDVLSDIDQAHVVAVRDVEDELPLVYLELCDGGSLQSAVTPDHPLDLESAIALAHQVLEGLDYLHERNIVHRDIAPKNLLFARAPAGGTPILKIADLGLAKIRADLPVDSLTVTGQWLGTRPYMCRQQMQDFKNAPAAVDVWSALACLYFMLTGVPPRSEPGQPILGVATLRADLPDALVGLIDEGLDDSGDLKWTTASALRGKLKEVGP